MRRVAGKGSYVHCRHLSSTLLSTNPCPPRQDVHGQVAPKDVELVRRDFAANGGWETFLAFEDPGQDILVGLLRLRRVSGRAAERQPELRGRCSIVRELHVYGTAVAVHSRDASKHQHQVTTPVALMPGWCFFPQELQEHCCKIVHC